MPRGYPTCAYDDAGNLVTTTDSEISVTAQKDAEDENKDKRFSDEKEALVEMAKGDKQTGMSEDDMETEKELNKQLPDPFPQNKVRGPETHPTRPHGKEPHGHVGPVNHIRIR